MMVVTFVDFLPLLLICSIFWLLFSRFQKNMCGLERIFQTLESGTNPEFLFFNTFQHILKHYSTTLFNLWHSIKSGKTLKWFHPVTYERREFCSIGLKWPPHYKFGHPYQNPTLALKETSSIIPTLTLTLNSRPTPPHTRHTPLCFKISLPKSCPWSPFFKAIANRIILGGSDSPTKPRIYKETAYLEVNDLRSLWWLGTRRLVSGQSQRRQL